MIKNRHPNGYTPTEAQIMQVLSDGMPHTLTELKGCLDELSLSTTVSVHLTNLRKKLEPKGQTILCRYYNRRLYYQHVGLLYQAPRPVM